MVGCTDVKEEESTMKTSIQLIRNATMRIEYGGKTFLTDPMFADKETLAGFLNNDVLANPRIALPVSIENVLKGVDAVILSHSHIPAEDMPSLPSDHFDPVAAETLAKDTMLYLQPFDLAGIHRLGFTNAKVIDETMDIDGIKVSRIIGRHVDIDPLLDMIGESSAYVFAKEGFPTLLWTGDTLLTEGIKEAITNYQPDIIITHSGGAQLPIDAEGNKATLLMDAAATIEVAKLAPEAKLVAVHLEALDHCPVTREGLREVANNAGISVETLIIPLDGEKVNF